MSKAGRVAAVSVAFSVSVLGSAPATPPAINAATTTQRANPIITITCDSLTGERIKPQRHRGTENSVSNFKSEIEFLFSVPLCLCGHSVLKRFLFLLHLI